MEETWMNAQTDRSGREVCRLHSPGREWKWSLHTLDDALILIRCSDRFTCTHKTKTFPHASTASKACDSLCCVVHTSKRTLDVIPALIPLTLSKIRRRRPTPRFSKHRTAKKQIGRVFFSDCSLHHPHDPAVRVGLLSLFSHHCPSNFGARVVGTARFWSTNARSVERTRFWSWGFLDCSFDGFLFVEDLKETEEVKGKRTLAKMVYIRQSQLAKLKEYKYSGTCGFLVILWALALAPV